MEGAPYSAPTVTILYRLESVVLKDRSDLEARQLALRVAVCGQ